MPRGDVLDEPLLIRAAVAAQRLSTWAMSLQVRAATEVYRRRAVRANALALGASWDEVVEDAHLQRRSTAAELGAACGITQVQAARRLETGWLLQTRPQVFGPLAGAFDRGEVELAKVEVVCQALRQVEDDATARAVLDEVLPRLASLTMPRLRRTMEAVVVQARPGDADERAEAERERRSVSYRAQPEAMGTVTAYLPIGDMFAVRAALRMLGEADRGADDARTCAQREADALVGALTGVPGSTAPTSPDPGAPPTRRSGRRGRRAATEIVVTVPASTLFRTLGIDPPDTTRIGATPPDTTRIGATPPVATPPGRATIEADHRTGATEDGPAVLSGYGPIPGRVLRELATSGSWRCAVVDDEHGTLLGLGRSTFTPAYAPGAPLARFVAARDLTCRFPGCGRRASTCEIDHVAPYDGGGVTCACNTHALCASHHRMKHETPWRIEAPGEPAPATRPDPPSTTWPEGITWVSPTGLRFTLPAPRLTPPPLPRHRLRSETDATVDAVAERYLAPGPEWDDSVPEQLVPVRQPDGSLELVDLDRLRRVRKRDRDTLSTSAEPPEPLHHPPPEPPHHPRRELPDDPPPEPLHHPPPELPDDPPF